MSQENVELNYQSHDAFNRRDLDAFLALTDPDVEFTPYERVIEGLGPYYGHDGVRTWWKEAFATPAGLQCRVGRGARPWGHDVGAGTPSRARRGERGVLLADLLGSVSLALQADCLVARLPKRSRSPQSRRGG